MFQMIPFKKIQDGLAHTLDFILPPRCVVSGAFVERQGMIDSTCWKDLVFITDPLCRICGVPFAYEPPVWDNVLDTTEHGTDQGAICARCHQKRPRYHKARAALTYNEGSRAMILKFKHADYTHNVRAFIPWLVRAGEIFFEPEACFIPVPLHRWRLLHRRYNQSALLAGALSRTVGIPWIPDGLLRIRSTPSQGHLAPDERVDNVRRAFQINPVHAQTLKDRKIILIDDVFTTGATVEECARCLYKNGAKEVNVLTLARTVRSA